MDTRQRQGGAKDDCEALAGATLRKEDGERSGWGVHGWKDLQLGSVHLKLEIPLRHQI